METEYHTLIALTKSSNERNLAISADSQGNGVSVKYLDWTNDLQYWELRVLRPDGAFAIINKARELCIARSPINGDRWLVLVGLDQILADPNPLALWLQNDGRPDGNDNLYTAIHAAISGALCINIPGDLGTYDNGDKLIVWDWSNWMANELWFARKDTRTAILRTIDFDMIQKNIQDDEPFVAAVQTVINNSSREQQQELSFTFTTSHTYSFEHQRGHKVSGSLEFKAGLPLVGESKIAIKVENEWKFTQKNEQMDQQEVTVDVPVTVPANTSMRVSVLVLRARLEVPYTAVVTYRYQDLSTRDEVTSGLFTGVNGYNVMTRFDEIGHVIPGKVLKTASEPRRLTAMAERGERAEARVEQDSIPTV